LLYKENVPSAPAVTELQIFKANFFKALAHPLRIRLLELLLARERSVQELQEAVGLEQPAVSQQLAVLRSRNIVGTRKAGTTVRYAVRDPRLGELLAVARDIFNGHLIGTQAMLRELRQERRR
jgi:DNA-binding transcriptional ArsR family regulator